MQQPHKCGNFFVAAERGFLSSEKKKKIPVLLKNSSQNRIECLSVSE